MAPAATLKKISGKTKGQMTIPSEMPSQDVRITDINTKDDAGYNSKKRMLVAGPTLMLDVPGFFNLSANDYQASTEQASVAMAVLCAEGKPCSPSSAAR